MYIVKFLDAEVNVLAGIFGILRSSTSGFIEEVPSVKGQHCATMTRTLRPHTFQVGIVGFFGIFESSEVGHNKRACHNTSSQTRRYKLSSLRTNESSVKSNNLSKCKPH